MTLSEIYQKGAEVLEAKNAAFNLRGIETEFMMEHNENIFKRYKFMLRSINRMDKVSLETKILGVKLKVPLVMSSITAPIPKIQEKGLLKVARALKETGSMMWTGAPFPNNLKGLVETGVPLVQTLKPFADRARVQNMLAEAEAAGATWVGIEVDAGQGTKILDRQMSKDCSPMSVDELKEMKKRVSIPFVLKGILSPWDAERALEVGADVIVVSNHGAHNIDYLPHPLEVMDDIVKVVAGQIPIVVDCGFRRGTDVLKGLAWGARAIGLGRPILYGLAADGEDGVRSVIEEIAKELVRVMTMTGVKDPAGAHRGILMDSGSQL